MIVMVLLYMRTALDPPPGLGRCCCLGTLPLLCLLLGPSFLLQAESKKDCIVVSATFPKRDSECWLGRTYQADHLDGGLQILLLSEHRLLQLLEVLGQELDLLLVHLGSVRGRLCRQRHCGPSRESVIQVSKRLRQRCFRSTSEAYLFDIVACADVNDDVFQIRQLAGDVE